MERSTLFTLHSSPSTLHITRVGARGFEPPTSWSQTMRVTPALRPEVSLYPVCNVTQTCLPARRMSNGKWIPSSAGMSCRQKIASNGISIAGTPHSDSHSRLQASTSPNSTAPHTSPAPSPATRQPLRLAARHGHGVDGPHTIAI